MEKPVGRWFVQMESKIPILEISVWGGVYHLNNRPNLPKEPRTSLDIFKMAAELVLLSEAVDASNDEELLLDHEEDEEFQVIAATSAFMKRELKRNVGFCEVVVPSYSIEEFKSHFRMAWNWFRMANGKHIFRLDTPFGNFGLPLETFRLFWKISVRANQNGLTIYIPTEISGIFW